MDLSIYRKIKTVDLVSSTCEKAFCKISITLPQISLILTPSEDPFLTIQAGKESEIDGDHNTVNIESHVQNRNVKFGFLFSSQT